MDSHTILQSPVITEKSMADANKGKFTFRTSVSASKDTIKKAVEQNFNVNVVSIATTIVKGRRQRVGQRRTEQRMGKWKKAIVTLKPGQKINLFDLGV